MEVKVKENVLRLIVGDITKQKTACIVNAANGTLLGGGGVDGAIHRAAGPKLLEECQKIRTNDLQGELLPTGEAVITKGYNLDAQHVIHTVGPIWNGGNENEPQLLANCFTNSLLLAKKFAITTIAFPAISTGVYRFPIDFAAQISLQAVWDFLQNNQFGEVVFVLFSEQDLDYFKDALQKIVE